MSSCPFDLNKLSYLGTPLEQARCLMRKVKKYGEVDGQVAQLPAVLETLLGAAMDLTVQMLRGYLPAQGILEAQIGGSLDEPVSRANDNDPARTPANYFVIHDTSSPTYPHGSEFPAEMNTAAWPANDFQHWSDHRISHLLINRLGDSFTSVEYHTPWRATKFESKKIGTPAKGLFLHHELIQPRIYDSAQIDANAPVPGFTKPQYDRLALAYVAASVRRGKWMVPAYHCVIDLGLSDGHDDPQNFDLLTFGESLQSLLDALRGNGGGAINLSQLTVHAPASELSAVSTALTVVSAYRPPTDAAARLGTIDLATATAVHWPQPLAGLQALLRLKGGQLYVDADMDIDADGSPNYKKLDPKNGLPGTAYNFPGLSEPASFVDAEKIPYFVLPGDSAGNTVARKDFFYVRMGIELGDLAAVISGGKVAFAMMADSGPNDLIGEGSIALSRDLDHEPLDAEGHANNGIDEGVLYIVFPGSKLGGLTPKNAAAKIRARGKELFEQLGGSIA